MIPRNCNSVALDRIHTEGGYVVARMSRHTRWWMHAMHVSVDGTINSYVPPAPLDHPLRALVGFDGEEIHDDPVRFARPCPKRALVISAWILAFGVTVWAIDRWVRGLLR